MMYGKHIKSPQIYIYIYVTLLDKTDCLHFKLAF